MINKQKVIDAIDLEKIIVIIRGVEKSKLIPLATALYDGGIRLIEITYSADGKVLDEEVADNISLLAKEFAGKMHVGAGTVLTQKQVELTAKAGGEFVLSPDTYPEVIEKTIKLNMVSIPGALTPSEIQTAHRCGADFVKLFPVTSLGTQYIKAIKAPLSHVKMLALGGIDENNLQEYLDCGICGFGIGSNIVKKDLIKNEDWVAVTQLAKKYIKVLKG